ncbi:MAG: hypothetical protein LLG37_07310 [Spirochaetia bacterium]|nr:hypothetical protein [Spirochaetia bacterium]
MRKIAVFAFVLSFLSVSSLFAFGELTEKVEKLVDTNQKNLERTYYPRDQKPNQFSLKFGPGLLAGVAYSYNLNHFFAVGFGAGTIAPGLSADMLFTAYLMPTTVAPYVSAGVVYYGDFVRNVVSGELGAGVDVALDNGFGVNLGVGYVRSFADTGRPFDNVVAYDDVNWFNVQGGLNYRF